MTEIITDHVSLAGEAELRRDVHAAAYPWQSLLGFLVGAGNAVGECSFEVAGIEGGEGRDEVWRGAVAEVRRAGGDGPAAGLDQVEQAAYF